jgi:SAM-dependent methyltransferase
VADKSPFEDQRWRVWHLDSELRYRPAVEALPPDDGRAVCEVGSGPAGLAAWTDRRVIGIDPGDDERHGTLPTEVSNLERKRASGARVPLEDDSVAAAVAVDTLEHIPPVERPAVLGEMARVTAPGGRVVLVGPAGPAAGQGDRWLIERAGDSSRDVSWVHWLHEHVEHGVPSVEGLRSLLLSAGAHRVTAAGVLNIRLWRIMHEVGLGLRPEPRGPLYDLLWRPFGTLARRYRRGPFYRWVVVGHL